MMKDHDSKQPARQERSQRNRPARPEASVNMDELRELIALLRDNGFSEFEWEREGFRVRLRRGVDFEAAAPESGSATLGSTQAPPAIPAPPPNSPSGPASAPVKGSAPEDQDLHIIPSPIVGTFYRSRSPNADSFVT